VRRKTMKKPSLWALLLILFFFSACGGRKTYLVDLRYVPQIPAHLKGNQATVAVAPFVDKRSHRDDVGIRKKLDGSIDRYTTTPTSASEGIRNAVKKFLRANGFTVLDVPEWDLKVESLSKVEADLIVGGEILRFWSQADSLAGRTIVRTDVEIVIYLGKPKEAKVSTQRVEMGREITQILFSSKKIEESLNQTLSEIIETAFARLLT
jgi:ribosomal protein L31E